MSYPEHEKLDKIHELSNSIGDFLEWLTIPRSTAFEEWAQIHRERKRRQVLEALGILTEYHHQQGDIHQMLEVALRQVEIDPFHESAHCQVMRALALSGQRARRSAISTTFALCC